MGIYRKIKQAVDQWEKQSNVPATDIVLGVSEYKELQKVLSKNGIDPHDDLTFRSLPIRVIAASNYIGISTQLLDKEERQALN